MKYLMSLILTLMVVGANSAQSSVYCVSYLDNYTASVYSNLTDTVLYSDDSGVELLGWEMNDSNVFYAYQSGEDGVYIVDTIGNAVRTSGQYRGMSVDQNNRILYSTLEGGEVPYLWLLDDGVLSNVAWAIHPNWGPNGQFSATKEDGALYIFETANADGQLIAADARYGVWSPNGQLFAYSTYPSGHLVVIDLATKEEVYRAPIGFWTAQIFWVDETTLVASGLWETENSHTSLFEVEIAEEKIDLLHEENGRDLYAPHVFECELNMSNAL